MSMWKQVNSIWLHKAITLLVELHSKHQGKHRSPRRDVNLISSKPIQQTQITKRFTHGMSVLISLSLLKLVYYNLLL